MEHGYQEQMQRAFRGEADYALRAQSVKICLSGGGFCWVSAHAKCFFILKLPRSRSNCLMINQLEVFTERKWKKVG